MVGVFKTTHVYLELLGSGAESEGEKCVCMKGGGLLQI